MNSALAELETAILRVELNDRLYKIPFLLITFSSQHRRNGMTGLEAKRSNAVSRHELKTLFSHYS